MYVEILQIFAKLLITIGRFACHYSSFFFWLFIKNFFFYILNWYRIIKKMKQLGKGVEDTYIMLTINLIIFWCVFPVHNARFIIDNIIYYVKAFQYCKTV